MNKHTENLANLIGISKEEAKDLYRKFAAIESIGHRLAEKYCNGEISSDFYDKQMVQIRTELMTILPMKIARNVYLNGDPRGYFLKLDDDFVRSENIVIERDWGGYGILAPSHAGFHTKSNE